MKGIFLAMMTIAGMSCGVTNTVNFTTKPNEVYENSNLQTLLKTNKSLSIVLKEPNSDDRPTSNTGTNSGKLFYSSIEKELLKNGFSVRDRGLFNEIVAKSQSTDYSKLKEFTNTDLILEVINFDPNNVYTTNKITQSNKSSTKEVSAEKEYKANGLSAEFRLVIVRNNEIAGTYKFYYNPCPGGCSLEIFSPKRKTNTLEPKESFYSSTANLEASISTLVRDLIEALKK